MTTESRKSDVIALAIVGAGILGLLFFGIRLLAAPEILLSTKPQLYYAGWLMLLSAALLAWFRHWVVDRLTWFGRGMHRLLISLFMVLLMGMETFLHLFHIPHMEGWWWPLIGGSAFVTGLSVWFCKLQGKPKD